MNILYQSLQRTKSFILKAPLFFLLLQIPEGILCILQRVIESRVGESSPWTFVITYPLFCIFSVVSTGATYLAVKKEGNLPLNVLVDQILKSLGKLSVGAIAVGLILIPAFLAFFLPGIYFMALYLFVPFLILDDPKQPISLYLFRSSKLAKSKLQPALLIASLSFIFSLLIYFAIKSVSQGWLSSVSADNTLAQGLGLILEIVLSMGSTLFIDLLLACFYQEIAHDT